MLTILIVDDEKKERDGIEKLIHRGNFELNVLKATNGEDALSVLSKQPIDILLTDIKMPFLDGISLLNQIPNRKELFLILYSAYADFEYAQNAISLGVSKYLLKPINITDFNKVMAEAMAWCLEKEVQRSEVLQLQKMQEYSRFHAIEKQLQLFLTSSATDDKTLQALRDLLPEFINNSFVPLLLTCEAIDFIEAIETVGSSYEAQPYKFVYALVEANTFLILLLADSNKKYLTDFCDLLLQIIRHNAENLAFVVAGRELLHLAELRSEYDQMNKYSDYYYFISSSTVVYVQRDDHIHSSYDVLQISVEKIITCVKAGNYPEAFSELNQLQAQIYNSRSYSAMFLKYQLTEMIKRITGNTILNLTLADLVNEIYATSSLDQTMEVIRNILKRLESKEFGDPDQNRLVRSVKLLIARDYSRNDMGLAYLAGQVNVSPAYLSALFKKKTGQNISKYIADYRIEEAKHLLKTTRLRVAEIGEKVGFQTSSYFISIFRSKENVSPAQYREEG